MISSNHCGETHDSKVYLEPYLTMRELWLLNVVAGGITPSQYHGPSLERCGLIEADRVINTNQSSMWR